MHSKYVIIHKTWVYKIEKVLLKTSWTYKTLSDEEKHFESFLYTDKSIRAVMYVCTLPCLGTERLYSYTVQFF